MVDDDPDFVEMLTGGLREDPTEYDIESAGDGYDALVKVGTFTPHLLIRDLYMARLDGFQVCRPLKRNPDTVGIRIVAITGHPGETTFSAAMTAGADRCLTKPVEPDELRQEIGELLDSPARGAS